MGSDDGQGVLHPSEQEAVINIRETEEVSWAGKMIISIVDLVSLRFKGATWYKNPAGSQKWGTET